MKVNEKRTEYYILKAKRDFYIGDELIKKGEKIMGNIIAVDNLVNKYKYCEDYTPTEDVTKVIGRYDMLKIDKKQKS